MLAARQREPLSVSEIFRAHRQRQIHVVLQRAHQIGIAGGREERDVEGIVGLVDAAQILRIGFRTVLPLQLDQLFDQRCRRGQRDHQRRLPCQHFPHLIDLAHFFGGIEPHGGADVFLAQHDALALELEQRLAHEMPAGAVTAHQRVLDQPRTRREAAEDDVFLHPPRPLRLLFLARQRRGFRRCGLRFHGRSRRIIAENQHGMLSIVNNDGHFGPGLGRFGGRTSNIDNNSVDSFSGVHTTTGNEKMADGLRKGLTSYGDAGFSLFLRKAFINAMGYSDDALHRPIVGITNTYSDYNPCHGHVPQIIEAVKRGVMLTGAMPMVFPTISIAESFSHPTSMYLRNLMAMDTEEMIRAQPMDAIVVIGGCDNTFPAQSIAAVRAPLPTVVTPVRPPRVGPRQGAGTRACPACPRLWGQHRAGEIDEVEIEAVSNRLAPSVGTCMVMGTASTMACVTEALGLSLPMSATIPAPHAERFRLAEASSKVAAEMAKAKRPKPSELLTNASFRNAHVVLQAIGGATNALVHLAAIARRFGIAIDL